MISVIVPVYNEPDGLEITLQSLIAQDLPKQDYEVIVVDNGSKDHTLSIAASYAKQHPQLIRSIVEDEIQGSYAARNKGIRQAKGEIICFIDADMTADTHYLSDIQKVFIQQNPDYVGCRVELYSNKNTSAAKFNMINGFKVEAELKNNQYVPTCCLSVKRSVFDNVGFFDQRLVSGGDFEFGQRVFAAGLQQLYVNHIVLQHPARWTYTSLVNKSKRIAKGIFQLHSYYPGKYEEQYLKYYRPKRHLPRNPLAIYRVAKQRDVSVNWLEVIFLSFYHIPITFISTAEMKKLKNQQQGQ